MHTVLPPHRLSKDQLRLLHEPVDRALARSAETLSELSGVRIAFTSAAIDMVGLGDVPTAVGNPGDPAIGIYVGMEGDGFGYVLLLMDESMAVQLAALMLGEEPTSISFDDELPASALAEAGNVACSSFMNEVGDATGLELLAMPPVVVGDMRGAILDVAIADIAQLGDDALLITTELGPESALTGRDGLLQLRLLVIPTPDTLTALLDALGSKARGE
ncbi:MAG TPA: chemotaxis protein CheX [Chloroflexota bacterium]|nr:chemotaxis protein CheX [Chloroflexota bacterium]